MAVSIEIFKSNEEWLQARNKVGGSDASSIVGKNPYKSNLDLYLEKTGQKVPEDISSKDFVQYGHQAEPLLRELFKLDFPEYEVRYEENNMFLNDRFPFAHASLDGWLIEKETGRIGILEIKTTNILQSMQKEKWNNRIPDNYYIQVLHYLMVTEFDFVVLKAQLKFEFPEGILCQTKHYHIERADVLEDISYLETKEREFWKAVQEHRQPALILPKI